MPTPAACGPNRTPLIVGEEQGADPQAKLDVPTGVAVATALPKLLAKVAWPPLIVSADPAGLALPPVVEIV